MAPSRFNESFEEKIAEPYVAELVTDGHKPSWMRVLEQLEVPAVNNQLSVELGSPLKFQ